MNTDEKIRNDEKAIGKMQNDLFKICVNLCLSVVNNLSFNYNLA